MTEHMRSRMEFLVSYAYFELHKARVALEEAAKDGLRDAGNLADEIATLEEKVRNIKLT